MIAQRFTDRSDAPGELEAMRIELAEIDRLVAARKSFAVETTLAPRAFERRIAQWKEAGYVVRLYFIYLSDPDQSIQRVRQRVAHGGHDVPEDVIRRRYKEGLRNFFTRYKDLADEWQFVDNTAGLTVFVASSSIENGLIINAPRFWSMLESKYRL